MSPPLLQLTAHTRRFNFTEVRPNFINPCCFGEDFAEWMRSGLAASLPPDAEISAPIQEDYGWGLQVARGKDTCWIALSAVADDAEGDASAAGEWVVTVTHDPGLNLVRRFFHRPDPGFGASVAAAVRQNLDSAPDIRIDPDVA